jgi:hypothetical protein
MRADVTTMLVLSDDFTLTNMTIAKKVTIMLMLIKLMLSRQWATGKYLLTAASLVDKIHCALGRDQHVSTFTTRSLMARSIPSMVAALLSLTNAPSPSQTTSLHRSLQRLAARRTLL